MSCLLCVNSWCGPRESIFNQSEVSRELIAVCVSRKCIKAVCYTLNINTTKLIEVSRELIAVCESRKCIKAVCYTPNINKTKVIEGLTSSGYVPCLVRLLGVGMKIEQLEPRDES